MAVHIQLRRDTVANWTASDPTPAEGEMCVETDTGKFKVGDGVTAYSGLPYSSGSVGPTGPAGADGAPGSVWYEGAGAPAVGTGIDGDYYLDTSTGDVYTKSAGAWGAAIGNLTGPTGATGAAGVGVPAGGAGGQVLTKIDATDYNTEWADATGGSGSLAGDSDVSLSSPADGDVLTYDSGTSKWKNAVPASGAGGGISIPYKTGWFYAPMGTPSGALGPTRNTLYLLPMIVWSDATLDSLSVYVTAGGATGATIRVGIWKSDDAGLPKTLVLDAGTLDNSGGVRTWSGLATPLTAGLYWFGFTTQAASAITVSNIRSVAAAGAPPMPFRVAASTADITGANNTALYVAGVTGALTDIDSSTLVTHTSGFPYIVLGF